MKYVMTRLELDAEQEQHPNQTKYKIFEVVDGKQIILEYFWETSKENAYNHLLEIRSKMNRTNIYFDTAYNAISSNDDGTITVYDSIKEMFEHTDKEEDEEESPYEVAKREKDAMMKDIKFFIDHYDHETNNSHMRCESWNLDTHILGDLEFNIPIIKAEANGVPQDYVDKACEMLHEDYDELMKNEEYDDKVFDLAKKLWHEELDNMLHHIWLYEYYSDHGIINDTDSIEKKDFLKNYKIPKEDGRYDVIDYAKVHELAYNEWKAIWKWMTQYGQSLWT